MTFFENVISLVRARRQGIYSWIRRPVDSSQYCWFLASSPLSLNPLHVPQLNSIMIPFGLVSGFLHHLPATPQYINEAPVAFAIAHELLHGVDPTGVGWDEEGKLSDILDHTSTNRFSRKIECMEKKMVEAGRREEVYEGRRIRLEADPRVSSSETLCDIGAMKVVLEMFDFEPRVFGTNFSAAQLFYTNIAQGFCGLMGSVAKVLHFHLNPHPPFRERVDNLALFSDGFSEAFQCSVGARLNPRTSCALFGPR